MKVCIYCASSIKSKKIYVDAVTHLGKTLAEKGHSLVYGGGDSGLMGAAARGFKEGGGHVTAIIPRFFPDGEVTCAKCDEVIYTDTMRQRKQLMEDNADVFVMAPGGIGTLDEFFEILTLRQLGRHNKAIVVYNINGYYDSFIKLMQNIVDEDFAKEHTLTLYKVVSDESELIDYIESYEPEDIDMSHTNYVSENKDV